MTNFKPLTTPDYVVHDALLTVDLGALAANIERYRALAHGAEVAGVVKANAYGLGLEPVARLMASEGVCTFFVTDAAEGMALRALFPEVVIYLTNGLPQGAGPMARAANLRPCLGSFAEIEAWAAEARDVGHPLPAALHFDTGMSRLGFDARETKAMLEDRSRLEGIEVTLVMSHLACADEPTHPLNARQLERFRAIAAAFPDVRKSLANSSGVLLGVDYCFDLVRPGYAIYGGAPTEGQPNPVLPVIKAEARVLQVREVDADEAAGYGATWQAKGSTRLATLSIGYADGFSRLQGSANGAGRVHINGHFAPIAGRVSMDLLTVDISDLPPGSVKRGDFAELIGPHVPLEEVAARAETIGYEVLTSLGDRYARRYTGPTASAES
jgi:alanine racemase